ncbi:MAG TPA: NAD(P)H-quinone oxidoreductase [Gemmatimonadaceae bacterium]|nr:NAD(P)H-quinone oxidoreductase [Gemmatimonadaceae bacterium]
MRAVVITRPGGPEVLAIEDRPLPAPGAGEILVRVRASALNRADLLQRQGNYPAPVGAPADIPGLEFAGEVAGVGGGVSHLVEGDRVFGLVAGGAHAEYLVTDAACAARVPDGLSWVEAASIPEAFITAHDALVTQAGLRSGEFVLVHAAGSGVGLAAIQITRAWQSTPFGTARTPEKLDRARDFGLADGIAVGDDLDVITAATQRWTEGHGIDVTLDLVGGPYVVANIHAAAPRGRIMIVGTVAGRSATIPIGMVLGKRLTLRGTMLRGRNLAEKRLVTAAFAAEIVPRIASGELRATIDSEFELDEIRAAHERLASNATFGKVVVRVE